jgi:hypothetical protein
MTDSTQQIIIDKLIRDTMSGKFIWSSIDDEIKPKLFQIVNDERFNQMNPHESYFAKNTSFDVYFFKSANSYYLVLNNILKNENKIYNIPTALFFTLKTVIENKLKANQQFLDDFLNS